MNLDGLITVRVWNTKGSQLMPTGRGAGFLFWRKKSRYNAWATVEARSDELPAKKNKSGLYSCLPKSSDDDADDYQVIGVIENRGYIQIHSDGTVRSEWARILYLIVNANKVQFVKCQEIQKRYVVPVIYSDTPSLTLAIWERKHALVLMRQSKLLNDEEKETIIKENITIHKFKTISRDIKMLIFRRTGAVLLSSFFLLTLCLVVRIGLVWSTNVARGYEGSMVIYTQEGVDAWTKKQAGKLREAGAVAYSFATRFDEGEYTLTWKAEAPITKEYWFGMIKDGYLPFGYKENDVVDSELYFLVVVVSSCVIGLSVTHYIWDLLWE